MRVFGKKQGLVTAALTASILAAMPVVAIADMPPAKPFPGNSHLPSTLVRSGQSIMAARALAKLTSGDEPSQTASAPAALSLQAWIDQSPVKVTGVPATTPPPGGAPVAVHASGAAAPDPAAVASILDLDTQDKGTPPPTMGMSAGQAVAPFLPTEDDFSHQVAQAIVQAFEKPKGGVAGDVAAPAAADLTPADPDFDERVALVMTLYQVDGTEAVIRHFVSTQHMKLIIKEVKNHIDIGRLSEGDKYRLASIAAVAQTELEDRIILLNARIQAANLTKPDLMQLIAAYDSDAQRKLTQMRLNDDGKADQISGIDVVISEYTILRDFIEQK